MIEIYADGAYNPLLSQGSWAAAVVRNGEKRILSGTVKRTTSNRMEITAALEGIAYTPVGEEMTIYTDSQYLCGCMTRDWQRRANRDLWEKLDEAVVQRKVRWEWLDQDVGHPLHHEVHQLANNLAGQHSEPAQAVAAEKESPGLKAPAAELTHLDALGRPRMVAISAKPDTERQAIAKCVVYMKPETLEKLKKGDMPKGDVFTTAQLAGIMAAKETPHLIPLCHPVLIGEVKVEFRVDEKESIVEITSMVKNTGKTGVEMEALTAAAVAALTVYDMCKAIDRGMRIDRLRLTRKSGGKSGTIILEAD